MTQFARAMLLASFILGATSGQASPNPKYGPAQSPDAIPLSHDHGYFQSPHHPAPDYWALAPFYVPQLNEFSCSVASVAAVVNALTRAGQSLSESDKNATHSSLLDSVKAARWSQRMQKSGFFGQYDTLTHASGGPYPHISPIAAYDSATKRALILDVDREYYEPYWVNEALVVKAMATRTLFFGHGGWIRVSR